MKAADFSIPFEAVHPGSPYQEIFFHEGYAALDALYPREEGFFFVTDSNVAALPPVAGFLKNKKNVFVLPAGEEHKTISNVAAIVREALEKGMNRKSVFAGIGGGVVTDMTGFAAAIFMRGAAWEAVPTTLLCMVDAGIGGKTGCDIGGHKNTAGAFFPARRVRVFPEFVSSLPEAEYRSGLGEVLKTALLFDEGLFRLLKDRRDRVLAKDAATVAAIARACAGAKAAVVEEDFMEKGRRAHLNLGHTFAHALESAAGLGAVTHGEAVAWGIGRALEVSLRLGLCAKAYPDEVIPVLASYGWETGPRHPALENVSIDRLLSGIKKDKKNQGGAIRLVLQRGMGDTVVMETEESVIREALS
jgi:3-dehydroquinate synthase